MTADAVPAAELARRLSRLRAGLREARLDAAVLVQTADLYYFSGTAQDAHLLVPARGEPLLLVRRSLARARRESALRRIEPLASLRELVAALDASGAGSKRIGFELDVLPAARYLDYALRLPDAELADCSSIVRRIRSVKSAWELDRIREAARQLAMVAEAVPAVLREGMTEIELAAELERLLRLAGHDGTVRARSFNLETHYGGIFAGPSATVSGGSDTPLVGSGPSVAIGRGASHRPIRRGDPVIVDLCGAAGGYLADQTRTYALGPVADRFAEAYAHAREILHGVAAEARPGVLGSHLYERAWELAAGRDGFMGVSGERIVSFVGHGFGLEIDEPPFLARGWDEPLCEGMVFALEPKFVLAGEGAVGVENSYAVTADGVDTLTSAPDELVVV